MALNQEQHTSLVFRLTMERVSKLLGIPISDLIRQACNDVVIMPREERKKLAIESYEDLENFYRIYLQTIAFGE